MPPKPADKPTLPPAPAEAADEAVMVEITTDRKPWADGRPLEQGERITLPAAVADLLIRRHFAREV